VLLCFSFYPRFVGPNPVEGDGFLRSIKILSTSPSGGGGGVKSAVPCRKILRHVEEPYKV
jgi:hypothetical protein